MSVNKATLYYEIKEPRGYGLIIVNLFNRMDNYKRYGAAYEKENFEKLFKSMGLEVIVQVEKTRDEMLMFLQEYANKPALKEHSMIAIAISSHGCEEGILGINIEERVACDETLGILDHPKDLVRIQDIRNMYNAQQCPNLAGKPKIIIINGCRGSSYETLIAVDILNAVNPERNEKFRKSTTWSDFYILFSCVQGHYSLRTPKFGSFYIKAFLETYNLYGRDLSFDEILPLINQNLIEASSTGWNQELNRPHAESCHWESTCTRILKIEPLDKRGLEDSARIKEIKPLDKRGFEDSVKVKENKIGPLDKRGFEDSVKVKEPISLKAQQNLVSLKCNWSTCIKNKTYLSQLPYQIYNPTGIAICDEMIYILDSSAVCIWVFKTDGEQVMIQTAKTFIPKCIRDDNLHEAWGILSHNDTIFVTGESEVLMFSTITCLLQKKKTLSIKLAGLDYFNTVGLLYVCDRPNLRLVTFDLSLEEVSRIWLHVPEDKQLPDCRGTARLLDVKCLKESLFALISRSLYTLFIYDYNGKCIHSIISMTDVACSGFFAVNSSESRIAIGDAKSHGLKIFDSKGNLIKELCAEGDGVGEFNSPTGIAFDQHDNIIIACSLKQRNMLQSFSTIFF